MLSRGDVSIVDYIECIYDVFGRDVYIISVIIQNTVPTLSIAKRTAIPEKVHLIPISYALRYGIDVIPISIITDFRMFEVSIMSFRDDASFILSIELGNEIVCRGTLMEHINIRVKIDVSKFGDTAKVDCTIETSSSTVKRRFNIKVDINKVTKIPYCADLVKSIMLNVAKDYLTEEDTKLIDKAVKSLTDINEFKKALLNLKAMTSLSILYP